MNMLYFLMINDNVSKEEIDGSHHKGCFRRLIVAVGAEVIHLGSATIWAAAISGSGTSTDHRLRGRLRGGLRGGLRWLRNGVRNWNRNRLRLWVRVCLDNN
jgi:hypothetical protein